MRGTAEKCRGSYGIGSILATIRPSRMVPLPVPGRNGRGG
jgi:hypothetical protein